MTRVRGEVAMWNENEAYFDYAEIRRRVERRLASGQILVIHIAVFLLAIIGLVAIFGPRSYVSGGLVWAHVGMTGWSGLLLLHSLWAYRNSGSTASRRLEAVQTEINERLEAGDTELLASPRQAFRVQSLLDEDVRLRAGWIPALGIAALVNSFIWGVSLIAGASTGGIWSMIVLLSILWFPATYAINQTRRRMRDNKLQRILAVRPVAAPADAAKRKRSFDAELERYARLSDDGELIDMPDEWAAYDADRKRK